jgi:HlyD family secretion protein
MSVTAEIETRTRTNVITVPIQSVTTRLPQDLLKAGLTNAATATNDSRPAVSTTDMSLGEKKKGDEPPKAIEVVFVVDKDHAKMVPVKRGISDDNYAEILEGPKEGQEVVSGTYKAINRELEDGKAVKVAPAKSDAAAKSSGG